eukprot:6183573-Pleurochrysis_carterae.AAC.1
MRAMASGQGADGQDTSAPVAADAAAERCSRASEIGLGQWRARAHPLLGSTPLPCGTAAAARNEGRASEAGGEEHTGRWRRQQQRG